MANGSTIISSLQVVTLQDDFVANDGTVIPKGTELFLIPQTLAAAVIVEGRKSLAELWPSISKTDHTHDDYAAALAGYQAELIKLTNRATSSEMKLAELSAWAVSAGFEPSNS